MSYVTIIIFWLHFLRMYLGFGFGAGQRVWAVYTKLTLGHEKEREREREVYFSEVMYITEIDLYLLSICLYSTVHLPGASLGSFRIHKTRHSSSDLNLRFFSLPHFCAMLFCDTKGFNLSNIYQTCLVPQ